MTCRVAFIDFFIIIDGALGGVIFALACLQKVERGVPFFFGARI